MRGDNGEPEAMFSYVSTETRIPQDHPFRAVRNLADACLREMSPLFAQLYARTGRPSIPPEKLLRAKLLQVLYTIRMSLSNYALERDWELAQGGRHGGRSRHFCKGNEGQRRQPRGVPLQVARGDSTPDEDPVELIRQVLGIEREIADGLEKLLREIEA